MSSFDWRSRLCWIGRTDSGVVRQRLYDRNILGIGLSVLDPGAPKWAAAIRNELGFPFWYSDPHWFGLAGDGSALKYRQQIDADMQRLAHPTDMLMLDLEQVSAEYVKRLLNGAPGNRGLVGSNNPQQPVGTQQGRPIAYTNEPWKDPSVVPYTDVALAGLHWYAQLYDGAMTAADGAGVTLEILRWMQAEGVGDYANNLHAFYDGARIVPDQRDGAYFTAERIPGVFTAARTMEASAFRVQLTKDSLRDYYTSGTRRR